MNDLRSRNRTLAPVPSSGPRTGEVVAGPGSDRAAPADQLFAAADPTTDDVDDASADGAIIDHGSDDPFTFKVSRELRAMPVRAVPDHATPDTDDEEETRAATTPADVTSRVARRAEARHANDRLVDDAPASRPSRRRDGPEDEAEVEEPEQDRFPWHFQFEDDEPQELQAKSPLLSRAFRYSVG